MRTMPTVIHGLHGEGIDVPTTIQIERDEWQLVHGSRTAERAAEFFGLPLADAIVERQPDDPRWPNEPVWRVKRKSQ